MKSCAISNLKKVSLELGGKSPLVIFADCDLDKAIRLVIKKRNQTKNYLLLITDYFLSGDAKRFL